MNSERPCSVFVVPQDKLYRAYCARCHYSRTAHEKWEEWEAEAACEVAAAREAKAGQ